VTSRLIILPPSLASTGEYSVGYSTILASSFFPLLRRQFSVFRLIDCDDMVLRIDEATCHNLIIIIIIIIALVLLLSDIISHGLASVLNPFILNSLVETIKSKNISRN
jgi:hypothetical protein